MTGLVGWGSVLFFLTVVGVLLYLVHRFEPRQLRELVSILNSKGGNVLLLSFFSMAFFYSAMQFFYHSLNLVIDKKISPENAVLMMGIAFVTGSAFGGAFGALITMLSGEVRPSERQSDRNAPRPPAVPPEAPPGP